MFYLNLAKLVANPTLIQKGQKLYLDGKVLASKTELISNWRSYGVTDNSSVFQVVAPTIHLINSDYNSDEYFQLAHCNCEYYGHIGQCHHIVAVMSYLDNKYKSSNVETKVNPSLWDTLMIGEKSTIVNQYKYNLNQYFEYNWDERDITKNLGSMGKDIIKYPELRSILEKSLQKNSKLFINEKKILTLFLHPYLSSQNSRVWFDIFKPYLSTIHDMHQVDMGTKIYLNLYASIYQIEAVEAITKFLINLPQDVKSQISTDLKSNYKRQPKVWIDFAFQSQDKDTLLSNLDSFDPQMLIRIANIYPYEHDILEIKIFNQIKVWSDFMNAGDYQDLLSVIEKCYLTFGRTEKFIDVIDYISRQHPKKKTLIKELQSY